MDTITALALALVSFTLITWGLTGIIRIYWHKEW